MGVLSDDKFNVALVLAFTYETTGKALLEKGKKNAGYEKKSQLFPKQASQFRSLLNLSFGKGLSKYMYRVCSSQLLSIWASQ